MSSSSSIEGLRNRKQSGSMNGGSCTEATTETTTIPSSNGNSSNGNNSNAPIPGDQTAKDGTKKGKLAVRVLWSFIMIFVFWGCILSGHLYVCGVVALAEFLVFRELVRVRYNAYFNEVRDTVPLFRTTQWAWFAIAIFYTYGDFIFEVIMSNPDLHYLVPYANHHKTVAFTWYSATFVLTIATMQPGHIKFQLNQLCWTIVVLCLTLGQMKYIMHNIYNGLIWFTLPFLLVCQNDVMAYFCGKAFGRKFISKPLNKFSPNKTWEGFIGGGICTVITAWYISRFLAQFTWMTCPVNDFELFPKALECEDSEIHHMFVESKSIFPPQLFDIFPNSLVKMIPGITEICAVRLSGDASDDFLPTLAECIQGDDSHGFHHFELVLQDVLPIQIHALWLGLFASAVAPFGGFLASAIKRAYGIKDFDSVIPGHGGLTDRFDCQFWMALCTWVHYNSFCRMSTISVPKLVYHYHLMNPLEKQQFLEAIVPNGGNPELLRQFQEYALSGILGTTKT